MSYFQKKKFFAIKKATYIIATPPTAIKACVTATEYIKSGKTNKILNSVLIRKTAQTSKKPSTINNSVRNHEPVILVVILLRKA